MLPNFAETFRAFATFDDNVREFDLPATVRDSSPELIIIRELVQEGFEAADFLERFTPGRHHGAQRKLHRLERIALAYLTPKVGVHANIFPNHSNRLGGGEFVETIYERHFALEFLHHFR